MSSKTKIEKIPVKAKTTNPHVLSSSGDRTAPPPAREALVTSDSLLHSIIDQSPYPMWVADNQGTLIWLNQTCREMLHITAAEVVGKYNIFRDNIVEQQGYFPLLQRVFQKGETVRFEIAYDTSLLKTVHVKTTVSVILDVTVSPVMDARGQITNAVFQHVDITERKRAEEALRQSEKKYRSLYHEFQGILNTMPDTLCLISPDFKIVWGNEASAVTTPNHSLAETFGKHCYALRLNRAAPCENCPVERSFRSGKLETEETIVHRENWELRAVPVYDDQGELLGAVELARNITQRKRMEKALEEEKLFTEAILDSLPGTFFLLDSQGKHLRTNTSGLLASGYSQEEVVKLHALDFIAEEDRPAAQRALVEVFENGKATLEAQHLAKDGRKTPFLFSAKKFIIDDKSYILGTGVDISARKEAEDALRESEKRLREAQEMAHLGFWYWNVKTGDVTWSEEVYKIFQLDPKEFTPHIDSILKLSPWPGDQERGMELIRKAMESHEKGVFEQRFLRPDRSIGHYYSTFQGKYDEGGNLTFIVGTVLDITERKRAEEALRESEARFRQVVEFSPLPIGIGNDSGGIEYVNPRFVETFGYTLEDLPRIEDWFRLAYPNPAYRELLLSRWQKDWERIKQGGANEVAEVEITCKDGDRRTMQVFGTLMGNKSLVVFNDLTERKRMEEALEKRLVSLSRPLDDAGDIEFHDLFNLRDIQRIQDLFAKSTGVASGITNPDGSLITEPSNFSRLCREIIRPAHPGKEYCANFHAVLSQHHPDGPLIKLCPSAGLYTACASITVGGKHIANWLIGQVRDEMQNEEDIRNYARALGADVEEFIAAFREVPAMSKDQFQQVAQALFVFANQLSTMAYQNVQQARFITERQRMEQELREKENKYRSLYQEFRGIIDAIPDGVSLISPDLKIVRMNESSNVTFMGKRPSETVGEFCYQARHGRSEPCQNCKVQDCFASGKPTSGESTTPEGRVFEIHAVPLFGDQGEVNGVIEVARDITARKRAEEERAKLEAQMREVQKLESLGVLAGGIAHDFNNLLMVILGNADLALLAMSNASPARPYVKEISQGSLRAADLCRQMLAYSGKARFVTGHYNLSEIVREMAQMLKVSVSKKASLRYSFAAGLPAVEVDATQMRQIIMNLIINASEALGDKNGFISVATDVMDCDRAYLAGSYPDDNLPEGRYVYLEVADTGSGMDDETRRRVFDPFFTTKFTGRGLGMAAVLGIVRGHQGAIKVYSEPGQGTTFKVLLPAVEWAPGDRPAHVASASPKLPGGTILLVDDDSHIRLVGSQMLERLGFKVETAAHGLEGLQIFKAKRGRIDCVILDLTMPGMAGDEVFRELRRVQKNLRVILSSGFNEEEVSQRFAGKGVAGFIQKPYSVGMLQEILNKVLGSK
ncbi:MAG: PAS domain S-box protein [Desulfobaccales bacterium]